MMKIHRRVAKYFGEMGAEVYRDDPLWFHLILYAPAARQADLLKIRCFYLRLADLQRRHLDSAAGFAFLDFWLKTVEGTLQTPFSDLLERVVASSPQAQKDLKGLIEARFSDLQTDPFETPRQMESYLQQTQGGFLRLVIGLCLGESGGRLAAYGTALGTAWGLCGLRCSLPGLLKNGFNPIPLISRAEKKAPEIFEERLEVYLKDAEYLFHQKNFPNEVAFLGLLQIHTRRLLGRIRAGEPAINLYRKAGRLSLGCRLAYRRAVSLKKSRPQPKDSCQGLLYKD